MNKTPEEIKQGLKCYIGDDEDICCEGCAYCGEIRCVRKMTDDALALIQQLEAERDALIESIKNCSLLSTFPLQCKLCKNVKDDFCGEKCKWCSEFSNFEWRGVPKEE